MKIDFFVKDSIQVINIGEYEIRKLNDGTFWIEQEGGEGMQVNYSVMSALIEKFYKENF